MPEPATDAAADERAPARLEDVDVLVVGAGLSGIGAACHLAMKRPQDRVVVLEARGDLGGTWDLFRYPGIRSDSDMFTLGFGFAPWEGERSIAAGADILAYLRETAREHGVDRLIRYRRRVVALAWDSDRSRWVADVRDEDTGELTRLTAHHVHSCTGYYRYDEGYTPQLPGRDRFTGTVVHPQDWPEDLETLGRRFVVVGSGATAMTLVPALARQVGPAGHVTMLQRSPSYVLSLPDRDPVASLLRRVLPPRRAYALVRWKNVLQSSMLYQASRRFPGLVRRVLRWRLAKQLPDHVPVDVHFRPTYDPWDQRLCLVPNGDLFRALRGGAASIVTDHIDTFTEDGIRLRSGDHLDADVVVTATGLNLLMMGGVRFTVDGAPVDLAETVAYKGTMLSGLPNFSFAVGYTNASWTLKVDLAADLLCRLRDHLDRTGNDQVWPQPPDATQRLRPLIDLESGYVKRSLDQLPRQGEREPWRLFQNYVRDVRLFRHGPVDDEGVRFVRGPAGGHGVTRRDRPVRDGSVAS
ncbi:NAD(P)/FAD-dependent oxidoreductase [Nitriliruptoraceae bacterium ZYF776]|nr:NAD(P)/FAD-dependent oxidoreductase [Profundirhabdus halotolerans]